MVVTSAQEESLQEGSTIKPKETWRYPEFCSHLFMHSSVGICVSDTVRFDFVNPKFAEITGYCMDELLHKRFLDIVSISDRSQVATIFNHSLNASSDASSNFSVTASIQCKDGSLKIVEITGGNAIDADGMPKLIAMLAEISDPFLADNQIKIINAKLREQAMRDPLTGLFNRRYFEESLNRELVRAERDRKSLSLIMGDLDRFKDINDTYGHQVGDDVLRQVGSILIRYSRGSDIPCRYGGEEFLLLLPDVCEKNAYERAVLLQKKVSAISIKYEETLIQPSASFGVASFPKNARDADKLIAAADKAMYRAKEAGRNHVCLAESNLSLFPGLSSGTL